MSGVSALIAAGPNPQRSIMLSPRPTVGRQPSKILLLLVELVILKRAHTVGSSGTELKTFGLKIEKIGFCAG